MIKKALLLVAVSVLYVNSVNCQTLKVSLVNKKETYDLSDSLELRLANNTRDSLRYTISLECFFEGKWSEIDNDIFIDSPRENHFFEADPGISLQQKIPISLLEVDKIFYDRKYRVKVYVLPVGSFRYKSYTLSSFEIDRLSNNAHAKKH